MSKQTTNNEAIETLRGHIKDIRMAMLSTVSHGRIVSRPMSVQEMGPDGTIWFLAGAESHKMTEIAANPTVCVAFVDPGDEKYISVAGTATITNDRKRIAEFWNPFYKAWFDGPDDPTIRVVEVVPTSAEYWITKGGKIVSLVSMLASAVTGKDFEAGENRTIEL